MSILSYVCDIGAGSIKIGPAGELTPEKVIPTIVAVAREHHGQQSSKVLLGDEAISSTDPKKYCYLRPIAENGTIKRWNHLKLLLDDIIRVAGINPKATKLLINKPTGMTKEDLRNILDYLLFEKKFIAITMHDQSALVLYTQGVDTGIVVELGETKATTVPVYRGHAMANLDKRMNIGGRTISKFLIKLLHRRGYMLDSKTDLEIARGIKEQCCYVSKDPRIEDRLAGETTVLEKTVITRALNSISVGRERFEAAEVLFQPKLCDSDEKGIADVIFDTIQEADIDCRVDLYQNIFLSGGTSQLPGLKQRLEVELQKRYYHVILNGDKGRAPEGWEVGVHAPQSRKYAVFEGGALLADLMNDSPDFWVTTEQYKKGGVQVVLEKCRIL